MNEQAFIDKMSAYMPADAAMLIFRWLTMHPARLRITRPRSSKLGDYRVSSDDLLPLITVNGNLNPYSFTITMVHEMAHHFDYIKRKTLQNAHGSSWKVIYVQLLQQMVHTGVFPNALLPAIERHMRTPKAASCSDLELLEALRIYDQNPLATLREIPEGSLFQLTGGRVFRKGELKRSRYRCVELRTGRAYMVHMTSEIEQVVQETQA